MNQEDEHIERVYYSISEVAEMFQVNPSLIRFWESEFDILKPSKNKNGERRFTAKDIQDLKMIYHLVKEKGFTLEGAKEQIRKQSQDTLEKIHIKESLEKLKHFLTYLRDNLDNS